MNKKENLNNSALYKKLQITNNMTQTAVKEFVKMIQEYLIFCYNDESLKDNNNKQYLINRGLSMLYYIFTTIFIYSKNLEITIYHCKKGFYYYVEFLGQIIEQDNTYLQLTSKDAILFVYKKTIFEINEQEKKTLTMTEDETAKVNIIFDTCQLYIDLISYMFQKENIDTIDMQKYHKKIKKNTKTIEKIINMNYFKEINISKINVISYFIKYMTIQNLNCDDLFQYVEYFVVELKTKHCNKEKIHEKTLEADFQNNLESNSKKKFIKWILN